ncbi:MAG: DUF2062 domain-containing protein [Sphingomonadales bacterium]
MLFRPRKPRTFLTRIGAFFWPKGGFARSVEYVRHRLGRLPDTPHRLAAGFASGVACSFTPLIGLHFVLAALLALTLRGNLVASAFGTIAGNPWTFPFIWSITYLLGSSVTGLGAGMDPFDELQIATILSNPWGVFGPILTPMLVGAIPLAVASWCATYLLLVRFFRFYRAKRRERIARRQRQRMKTA